MRNHRIQYDKGIEKRRKKSTIISEEISNNNNNNKIKNITNINQDTLNNDSIPIPNEITVTLTNSNDNRPFTYSFLNPNRGPLTGGTRLSIFGSGIPFGDIRILFSSHLTNKILHSTTGIWESETEISFISPSYNIIKSYLLEYSKRLDYHGLDMDSLKKVKILISINSGVFRQAPNDFSYYIPSCIIETFPSYLPSIYFEKTNEHINKINIKIIPDLNIFTKTELTCEKNDIYLDHWRKDLKCDQLQIKITLMKTNLNGKIIPSNQSWIIKGIYLDKHIIDDDDMISYKRPMTTINNNIPLSPEPSRLKRTNSVLFNNKSIQSEWSIIQFMIIGKDTPLPIGIYGLQISLNGQQYSPLHDIDSFISINDLNKNINSSTSFCSSFFSIALPAELEIISPPACYLNGGQELAIKGKKIKNYSKKNIVIIQLYQNQGKHAELADIHLLYGKVDELLDIILFKSPKFLISGKYKCAISLNDGAHFFEVNHDLMVYMRPICNFIFPIFGSSDGNTLLGLRISFIYRKLHHSNDLYIPMEESDFEETGQIFVRFILLSTNTILNTVPGKITKNKKFIECYTPANPDVETFQYSVIETVGLQISFDGNLFFNISTSSIENSFSYYLSPNILSLSVYHGPETGGTKLLISLEKPIPDTKIIQINFISQNKSTEKRKIIKVNGIERNNGYVIECITPKWELIKEKKTCFCTLEISYNGAEFSNIGNLTYSTFMYYKEPTIEFLYPKSCSVNGNVPLSIYGDNIYHHGPDIRVAFSDGVTTKYTYGELIADRILCNVPNFTSGKCRVCISLNGQQFTGKWTETGDCISDDVNATLLFYELPRLSVISPQCGHIRGGTNINIYGKNIIETEEITLKFIISSFKKNKNKNYLEYDTNSISIDDSNVYIQTMESKAILNESYISCSVPASEYIGRAKISIALNGRDFIETNINFTYYKDIQVKEIIPNNTAVGLSIFAAVGVQGMPVSSFILGRLAFPFIINNQMNLNNKMIYYGEPSIGELKNKKSDQVYFNFNIPNITSSSFLPYVNAIITKKMFIEIAPDGQCFELCGNILKNEMIKFYRPLYITSIYPFCIPDSTQTILYIYGRGFNKENQNICLRFTLKDKKDNLKFIIIKCKHNDSKHLQCLLPLMKECIQTTDDEKDDKNYHELSVEYSLFDHQYLPIYGTSPLITKNKNCIQNTDTKFSFIVYKEPIVSHINCLYGPIAGGTRIFIFGSRFQNFKKELMKVRFLLIINEDNDSFYDQQRFKKIVDFLYISSNIGECISPSLPFGSYEIQISFNGTNYSNYEINNENHQKIIFNVYTEPFIQSIEPTSGPDCGGTTIQINGENFIDNDQIMVSFTNNENGVQKSVKARRYSNTLVTCKTPSFYGCTGNFIVKISMNGQQFSVNREINIFFKYFLEPQIIAFVPSKVPSGSNSKIKIIFNNVKNVFIDAQNIQLLAVNSYIYSKQDSDQTLLTSVFLPPIGSKNLEILEEESHTLIKGVLPSTVPAGKYFVWISVKYNNFDSHIVGKSILLDVYTQPLGITYMVPSCGPLKGGTKIFIYGKGWIPSDDILIRFCHYISGDRLFEIKGNLEQEKDNTRKEVNTYIQCNIPTFPFHDVSGNLVHLKEETKCTLQVAINGRDYVGCYSNKDPIELSTNIKMNFNSFFFYKDPLFITIWPSHMYGLGNTIADRKISIFLNGNSNLQKYSNFYNIRGKLEYIKSISDHVPSIVYIQNESITILNGNQLSCILPTNLMAGLTKLKLSFNGMEYPYDENNDKGLLNIFTAGFCISPTEISQSSLPTIAKIFISPELLFNLSSSDKEPCRIRLTYIPNNDRDHSIYNKFTVYFIEPDIRKKKNTLDFLCPHVSYAGKYKVEIIIKQNKHTARKIFDENVILNLVGKMN